MIKFKHREDRLHWAEMDERLITVACWLAVNIFPAGVPLVVTSVKSGHSNGPHADGRAIDIRTSELSPAQIAMALAVINSCWPWCENQTSQVYRPTLLYESPNLEDLDCIMASDAYLYLNGKATAPHFHLQVPRWETPTWRMR